MELSHPRMDRSVVMVTFVNHTSCECLSKRPLHSIIRRAATDHLWVRVTCAGIYKHLWVSVLRFMDSWCLCVRRCSPPDIPCASGSLWDPVNCMCVSTNVINYSERETGKYLRFCWCMMKGRHIYLYSIFWYYWKPKVLHRAQTKARKQN